MIIGIDDESLQSVGRWPWNRTTMSQLIDAVPKNSVVGIDVGLFEASALIDDKQMSQALARHGNVVLVSTSNSDGSFQIPAFNFTRHGYADVITDTDGITRATRFDLSADESAFSVVVYDLFFGAQPTILPSGRTRINFVGPAKSFTTVSAKIFYQVKLLCLEKVLFLLVQLRKVLRIHSKLR